MQVVYLSIFGFFCLFACSRPAWALALIVFVFPIEQLMQSLCEVLRSSALGLQAVNFAVGGTALLAALRSITRSAMPFRGYATAGFGCVAGILLWSLVTLAWSPADRALEFINGEWPYTVVFVILGTLLVGSIEDLSRALGAILIVGTVACAVILVNPEFTSVYGRLAVVIGANTRSNSLALGDLGGTTVIVAALLRRGYGGPWLFTWRVAGLLLGTAVAVYSGARGQMIGAAGLGVLFFPLAAPIRNVGGFFLTVFGLGFVALLALLLASTILTGFAAQRFSLEAILYGASSADTRVNNVLLLFTAWAGSPFAWVFGLGVLAYNVIDANALNPYSHVAFADALFELGIPGAALMAAFVYTTVKSLKGLFAAQAEDPVARAAVATLIALCTYLMVLANKQGFIWNLHAFYMFSLVGQRLMARSESPGIARSVAEQEGDALGQPASA
jgi:hypothetical protein